MKFGIERIAYYIPEGRIENSQFLEKFEIDQSFLNEKIGVQARSIKDSKEETSDLCVKAFANLHAEKNVEIDDIDVVIVVTQNPDYSLPHTSAIVHKKLALKTNCACFDISLGCSGFVYGLSIITSFMKANDLKKGLLFTADPYSKVINQDDKNTSLIFGDAGAVALISSESKWMPGKFTFGTQGEHYDNLIVKEGELSMNGRGIFNFAATEIPKDLIKNLELNHLSQDQIDYFVFHPGSKYIVDTLAKRCRIDPSKVKFGAEAYGNTVSSSIPILLADLPKNNFNNIFITGFGVGLSWSSTVLTRNDK